MPFSPCSCKKRYTPDKCSYRLPPTFGSACLGYLPTPKRRYEVYIVGKRGKEQTIFPELSEHCTELPQVFPQECVRRRFVMMLANTFRLAATDVIPYIRVMFLRVPVFNILCASHRPLERWQSVDSWMPVRSLMTAVPCGHGTDRQKRTEDSYEYMHHCVRGLKLPMGTTEILITFRSKIRLNGFLMPLKRKKVLSLHSFSKQKNVFVKPNGQRQTCLSCALARKRTYRRMRKEQ